jgi:plasmid maintenance system antidote protein VapI
MVPWIWNPRLRPVRGGDSLEMSPEFWLNLQRVYDHDLARASTDTDAIELLVGASA